MSSRPYSFDQGSIPHLVHILQTQWGAVSEVLLDPTEQCSLDSNKLRSRTKLRRRHQNRKGGRKESKKNRDRGEGEQYRKGENQGRRQESRCQVSQGDWPL